MFTQKHYIAIADLIHKRRVEVKTMATLTRDDRIDEINTMTLAMTKLFKSDNPKFKEFTFIEACNRDLKE